MGTDFGENARPGIPHVDLTALVDPSGLQDDRPALVGSLNGVENQIGQHLLDHLRIDKQRRQVAVIDFV